MAWPEVDVGDRCSLFRAGAPTAHSFLLALVLGTAARCVLAADLRYARRALTSEQLRTFHGLLLYSFGENSLFLKNSCFGSIHLVTLMSHVHEKMNNLTFYSQGDRW